MNTFHFITNKKTGLPRCGVTRYERACGFKRRTHGPLDPCLSRAWRKWSQGRDAIPGMSCVEGTPFGRASFLREINWRSP